MHQFKALNPFLLLLLFTIPTSATLASPIWQSNDIYILSGDGYEVNPSKQTTFTLEHASGWGFGDLFFFYDVTQYPDSNQEDSGYGEFSPRFSLGKLSGNKYEFGPIKDILAATSIEFGKGDVESLLLGIGFDFNFPSFEFFTLNIYKRFTNNNRDGNVIQITPAWNIKLTKKVSFGGYIDWNIENNNTYNKNFHFNPRIKYNFNDSLSAGLEYSYWTNKYGIKDSSAFKTNQNTSSLFISYHF